MLRGGILHPGILGLLARFRHTNTIVIADRGFPYWPQVETFDLALVDDLPKVTDVLRAVVPLVVVGKVWMAQEFLAANQKEVANEFRRLTGGTEIEFEPHAEFKRRVPGAIGLIRTGDTTPYGNVVLESA
jgi:D-ribose pyranase